MLALYVKDNKIPIDLHDKEFLPILQEDPLPPLALVPFTEEEQRNFSMSVNSAAVLRLTGRGAGVVAGAPRGRSTSRGRGRGRGDGGFYQRSFDEVEGGFGRGGREMHRSQSWEERGDRRFEKPGRKDPEAAPVHYQLNHVRANYEEAGAAIVRKHDFTRSESENWRMSREEQNEGPRSAGWREHPERRRFPFDARGDEERGYRRPRSGSGSLDDERDMLPEWCLEDAEEETGIFDSSGAFHSLKKGPKEPILEEAELDFRPLEECEELSDGEESECEETKDIPLHEVGRDGDRKEVDMGKVEEKAAIPEPLPADSTPPQPSASSLLPPGQLMPVEEIQRQTERAPDVLSEPTKASQRNPTHTGLAEGISLPHVPSITTGLPVSTPTSIPTLASISMPIPSLPLAQPQPALSQPVEIPTAPTVVPSSLPFTPTGIMAPISRPGIISHDAEEDEGLKHFEQEAEKMVAYLQDGVVDDEQLSKSAERPKPAALAITHEAAFKWFYKDPQGEIQGPFSNQEMTEWFQAGYFTMTLLVKRGCDEVFQPLGEIIKIWGRVPFTPGPALPPILADVDQERLKRQQEITAINLYQMQQLQYQYLLRQQFAQAQALAQQKAAVLNSAPPPPPPSQPQPQQQQINLLLHQALKIRSSETLLPPVTHSMAVQDSGSVWDIQSPPSQATCAPSVPPSVPSTAWEGTSVWDLPVDSMAPGSSIEQMQHMEKAKALKLELERREAELRAKNEEEERKRLEEALRARQEEEQRKRREEEELARRKQEEALRRQRELEEAQRRQKEEEERLAQEEAQRRLEERRREEEEERRQREEFLRKQEEERRKQEELEALRKREEEEEKRREAEAVAAAAALLARQQQEELQRREQELQRQQEAQRQRQQQQEALRRLQQQQQQQQLAHMKLPSSSKWGQQSASLTSHSHNALSLAEIQKLEEEKERQAQLEQRKQQQEILLKAQQCPQSQTPQAKLSGWGQVAKQPATTKSLLEIQREEAQQQMKQRKEQKQPQAPQLQTHVPQNRTNTLSSSVWGSGGGGGGSSWVSNSSSIWGDSPNSNVGFWDDAVKEAAQPPPPPPSSARKQAASQKNKGNANLSNSLTGKANKKVEEEEKLMKLFQAANKNQDSFMQWCEQTLHTLNTANNLDVPTFASFLKEVDSPYEVQDYVKAYLGDTPQATDFAKQFLERRAKQNANKQKQQQTKQQQDSVWGGTAVQQVLQTNHTSLQQQRFETVTSGKKKKKQKMVRADPSLLGFSVNASSERLNMGEIETVEDF